MQRGDAITPLATWVIHSCSVVQKEADDLWGPRTRGLSSQYHSHLPADSRVRHVLGLTLLTKMAIVACFM